MPFNGDILVEFTLKSIRCPKCGSTDVRLSQERAPADIIPKMLFLRAIRCRSCRHRFFRWVAGEA